MHYLLLLAEEVGKEDPRVRECEAVDAAEDPGQFDQRLTAALRHPIVEKSGRSNALLP